MISVEDKNTKFEVICPRVVKPEEESYCSLIVTSGSFLMMNYKINEEVSLDFEFSGTYYLFILYLPLQSRN